jgi:hypothetical protein
VVEVNLVSGQQMVKVNMYEGLEVPEVVKSRHIKVSQVRLHTSIPMPS